MEIVYKKIVETFNAHPEVFTSRGLPVVRQIDLNIGQPDDPENFEVFCPAMFISWSIRPGTGGESDTLTLDFHLLQEPTANTENFSNVAVVGVEYIKLMEAVKYLLNDLKTSATTPLRYAGEQPAVTPYFRYHVVSYTCSIDAYTDSIHKPALGEGQLSGIVLKEGKLREKQDSPKVAALEVDTYSR